MSTNKKNSFNGSLFLLASIGLGVLIGFYLRYTPPSKEILALVAFPGQIFMKFLRMLVIPLIFSSVISGLAEMGNSKQHQKIIGLIIAFIFIGLGVTYFVALGLSLIFCPELLSFTAQHTDLQGLNSLIPIVLDVFYKLVPDNIFHSLSASDGLLGVLFFSLFMGFIASYHQEKAAPFIQVLKALQKLIISMFPHYLVIVGVGSIVAHKLATEQNLGHSFSILLKFIGAEVVGYLVLSFVILPLVLYLFTKNNPFVLMRHMSPALLFSMATTSSTGTIPYSLKALDKAQVSPNVSSFFIPFGSAVNIWGSGFHKASSILFLMCLAQTPLTLESGTLLFILCLIFATGGAGMPSGSVMVLPSMLGVLGLPGELVAYIIPIDWMLDRLRTPTNVWGDAVGAYIIDHYEKG